VGERYKEQVREGPEVPYVRVTVETADFAILEFELRVS
jgi:hypothetical protein